MGRFNAPPYPRGPLRTRRPRRIDQVPAPPSKASANASAVKKPANSSHESGVDPSIRPGEASSIAPPGPTIGTRPRAIAHRLTKWGSWLMNRKGPPRTVTMPTTTFVRHVNRPLGGRR